MYHHGEVGRGRPTYYYGVYCRHCKTGTESHSRSMPPEQTEWTVKQGGSSVQEESRITAMGVTLAGSASRTGPWLDASFIQQSHDRLSPASCSARTSLPDSNCYHERNRCWGCACLTRSSNIFSCMPRVRALGPWTAGGQATWQSKKGRSIKVSPIRSTSTSKVVLRW